MCDLGYPSLLFFQNGGAFFVGEDGAFKAAKVGGFGGWNLDLADGIFAFVVEEVAFGGDRRVIAGKVEVEIDWVGSFIDYVTGRQGDIEAIAPTAGGI